MATQQLDLGAGDVHVPGAARPEKKQTMADISAAQRKKLPASKFADPADRKYPIHDKAHADNAAARLEQEKGSMSPGKYASVKRRVKSAQKRFGEKTKATAKSGFRGSTRGLRMSITSADGTRTEVRHMAAYYSDKNDQLILSLPLDKATALGAGDENKRVWVQVGKTGRWLGHRQGPFELNSQVFDALVRNFKTQNVGRLQYDFEHASEMKPTDGMIPLVGAPAQGWIYDLKHDGRNLYALTEWKDLARQYIENDQYSGVSPAISWKNKDRTTGVDIGPILTSVALTNKPFLTGMAPPQAASLEGVTWLTSGDDPESEDETEQTSASAYCYSTDEYMPRVKNMLGLHELSTPQQCSDMLSNLREHFDASGGDAGAAHQGVPLSKYLMPMRDLSAVPMGSTWDDVFDAVGDMIDAAIDEHEIEFHPDGPPDAAASAATAAPAVPTTASASAPASEEPIQMAMTDDEKKTLATLTDQVSAAQVAQREHQETVQTLSTQVTGLNTQVSTLGAQLTSKDREIEALRSENTSLLSFKTETAKKETDSRVTAAITTWGQKRGLKEEDRPWLTTLCSNSSAEFDKAYPPVPADQQHLLTNQTERGSKDPQGGAAPIVTAELPEMSLMSIATTIANERKIPLEQALLEAERILNKAKASRKG